MARHSIRLKADVVRERMKALGLTQQDIAGEMSKTKRAIQNWLAHDPAERRGVTVGELDELAELLGMGTLEIAEDPVPDARPETLEDARRALLVPGFFTNVVRWIDRYSSYLRFISLRLWPTKGFVKSFTHGGEVQHGFAEIRIVPAEPFQGEERRRFVFSFVYGGIARVDYGHVDIMGTEIVLVEYFTSHRKACTLVGGAEFYVWTWFGRERCEFLVRSNAEFSLHGPDLQDARSRNPDQLPANTTCFAAAPNHILAAKEDGVELPWAPDYHIDL